MTTQDRMEALSLAYVTAVAAEAGLTYSVRRDYGIDLSLHEIEEADGRFGETGFTLDLQVKSTTAAVVTADAVSFRLEVKNYNDLRRPNAIVPRLLVLVALRARGPWVRQDEDRLELRGCAYWRSLVGEPPVGRRKDGKVTVAVPRQNLFTPAAIRGIIAAAKAGGGNS